MFRYPTLQLSDIFNLLLNVFLQINGYVASQKDTCTSILVTVLVMIYPDQLFSRSGAMDQVTSPDLDANSPDRWST